MIEAILIVIIAVTFAKASKNKSQGQMFWAIMGVLFYGVGRFLFIIFLAFLIRTFFTSIASQDFAGLLITIELVGGVIFGLCLALFLGEFFGLNIRRILKG